MTSKKSKSVFVCSECGATGPKWLGRCEDCGGWNTLEERAAQPAAPKGAVARQGYAGAGGGVLAPLSAASGQRLERIPSGLAEYDLVLGGGLVRGSSIVLGGNPGAGKSTLFLQSGCHISLTQKVIYCAGEETTGQIRDRGQRLGLPMDQMLAIEETNVLAIGALMESERPDVIIVDSIQTCFHPELESEPGNPGQLKTCAAYLNRTAKRLGIALLLVGHINKNEAIAGPMALMHIVDAVLMLASTEDARFRLLRAEKNRFGSTSEVGIFEMTGEGLSEVDNPSAIFLSRTLEDASGTIVTPLWEGTRPLLVEVQGLLDESVLGNPRRVSVGVDNNRLAMLLAVINKHTSANLATHDVYVNVVGGLKVTETSVDLAIALAALSSYGEVPIGPDVMAFGEIGLSGEVRPCLNGAERIREAAKLGFRTAIVPHGNVGDHAIPGLKLVPVTTLGEVEDRLQAFVP